MRLATLAFSLLLSLVSAAVPAGNVTLTGTVSEMTCRLDHHRDRNPADCTRACTEEGSPFALIVGSRVYTLIGEDEVKGQLYELAGQRVTVIGEPRGNDVVAVTSVEAVR